MEVKTFKYFRNTETGEAMDVIAFNDMLEKETKRRYRHKWKKLTPEQKEFLLLTYMEKMNTEDGWQYLESVGKDYEEHVETVLHITKGRLTDQTRIDTNLTIKEESY